MSKYLFIVAMLSIFNFTAHYAFSQDIELIWLEINNTDSTIFYSQHKNGGWSPKESVVSGNKIKLTPAIASSANKSVAVWVASNKLGELSLAYSIKTGKKWQRPQPISFDFQETSGPALISYKHQFFLFFAGNRNDDDDIYMSTFEKNGWSDPIMVHPDNNVPDFLPEPRIINGALTIVWQHFDGESYVYQSQEVLPLGKNEDKQTNSKLNFQRKASRKATKKELQSKNTNILKTKFNVNLPSDFKGIGLSKAYVREDQEMPALHIHTESN